MISQTWLILLGAYLLGAIPFAYIVTRIVARADIRQLGDGNVGAKNTFESVGKLPGLVVAVADFGKGVLAVVMARTFSESETTILMAGASAVLGHDFSIFLRLQGGQGMAATIGVFGALFPVATLVGVLALAIVLALTHNWDLSSGIGLVLLIIMLWWTGQSPLRLLYAIALLPVIGLKKILQSWQRRRLAV